MIKIVRSRWAAKLLVSFLTVVLLTGLIHTAAMNLTISSTYTRHFGRMGESMQGMMEGRRGMPLFENFRAAVNDSLAFSAVAAFIIAVIASLFLSRLITRPVKTLTQASQSLSKGDYQQRVPQHVITEDELGQLATSFNQMAEKLEQTELLRKKMIADISHELRTPLTVIKGSLEGLMDGILEPSPETYQHIFNDAQRLQRLIEDLQELSQVESDQFNLHFQQLPLNEVIHEACDPLRSAFEKKVISLNVVFESDQIEVSADRDRLIQVLRNLLDNALRYTPTGGHVELRTITQDQIVRVMVRDDGAGINPEDLPHIFERFYRADRSRSRLQGGGSGIGLTICKTLIEAHGGRIWVESDGAGSGSSFFFTLPSIK